MAARMIELKAKRATMSHRDIAPLLPTTGKESPAPTPGEEIMKEIITSKAKLTSTVSMTDNDSSFDLASKQSLNFDRAGLVGRDKEKRIMSNAIRQLLKQQPADGEALKTLCLISGPSGSGKSKLATHYRQHCLDSFAFFVCGKFDLHQMEEPYAGIRSAMGELMEQIKLLPPNDVVGATMDDPRRVSRVHQALVRNLSSSELRTLHKIVPGMYKWMTGEDAVTVGTRQSKCADLTSRDATSDDVNNSNVNNSNNDDNSDTAAIITNTELVGSNSMIQQKSLATLSIGSDGERNPAAAEGYKEKSDRIKHTLKRFLQIICQHSPLVLMMDDIQWADKASLDLIETWTLDAEIPSLMIVGCFRSNELEQNESLQGMIGTLENLKRERAIRIINIHMSDLPQHSVRRILVEILLPDKDDDVNGLADIVHRKTGGNIFFVKQFLESLVDDDLLWFDEVGGMKWLWEERKIIAESSATDNIVDLMKHKLHRVDDAHQALPIAACLGCTFSRKRLMLVIRAFSIHSDHRVFFRDLLIEDDAAQPKLVGAEPRRKQRRRQSVDLTSHKSIQKVLDTCEREGLIEQHSQHQTKRAKSKTKTEKARAASNQARNDDDRCTFIHDKIQEAALALVPQDKLSELQHRVGDILLSSFSNGEMEDHDIYMVAGLINTRLDLIPATAEQSNRRMRIAMLNYKTAQLAVECAAFQAALRYFATAMQMLPTNHWKSHFAESLDIYASAAECAYLINDSNKAKEYCSAVLSLECPLLHKVRTYHIFLEVLFTESQAHKTVKTLPTCINLLSMLGCELPKSSFSRKMRLIFGLSKMKRVASKWTVESFRSMPASQDPTQMAIVKTLNKSIVIAFVLEPDLFPLIIVECVRRTLKYGIMPCSAPAFSCLALLVGYFMGDFVTAVKICKVALAITDRESNQFCKCQVMYTACLGTMHWVRPLGEIPAPFWEAYELGMACGDVDSAIRALMYYWLARFYIGVPLPQLDEEMLKYSKVMEDFQRADTRSIINVTWQSIRNLRGLSDNDIKLKGDIFDEDDFFRNATEESDNFVSVLVMSCRQTLGVFLGEYEYGASASVKIFDEELKVFAGSFFLPLAACYSGVCCYAASHSTSNKADAKRYRKFADKCRKQLQVWADKGNPNCDHRLALLEAEHKMLRSKYDFALFKFRSVIEMTDKLGCIHEQALANERLSECLVRMGKRDVALLAMAEAIRLYEEWGAMKKVEKLRLASEKMRQGARADGVAVSVGGDTDTVPFAAGSTGTASA